MVISWMPLMVMAVVGLVLLGAVVVLVLMLTNPRTRIAGMVLSLLGLLGVVFVGVGLLFVTAGRQTAMRAEQIAVRQAVEAKHRAMAEAVHREEFASRALAESETTVEPPAAGPATAEAEDADATAEKTGDADDATDASNSNADEPESVRTAEPHSPPGWLNSPSGRQSGAYQMALRTDPRENIKACEAELPTVIERALAAYIHTELGFSPAIAGRVRLPWDYVESHLIQERWQQPVDTQSFGQWVELHVLVQIDSQAENRIHEQCKQAATELAAAQRRAVVHGRLWLGGTALAVVLTLLAVTFGYFKIDATTGGSYRWRLRMTALIVIMGLIVGAFVCVRKAPIVPADGPIDQVPPRSMIS